MKKLLTSLTILAATSAFAQSHSSMPARGAGPSGASQYAESAAAKGKPYFKFAYGVDYGSVFLSEPQEVVVPVVVTGPKGTLTIKKIVVEESDGSYKLLPSKKPCQGVMEHGDRCEIRILAAPKSEGIKYGEVVFYVEERSELQHFTMNMEGITAEMHMEPAHLPDFSQDSKFVQLSQLLRGNIPPVFNTDNLHEVKFTVEGKLPKGATFKPGMDGETASGLISWVPLPDEKDTYPIKVTARYKHMVATQVYVLRPGLRYQ